MKKKEHYKELIKGTLKSLNLKTLNLDDLDIWTLIKINGKFQIARINTINHIITKHKEEYNKVYLKEIQRLLKNEIKEVKK